MDKKIRVVSAMPQAFPELQVSDFMTQEYKDEFDKLQFNQVLYFPTGHAAFTAVRDGKTGVKYTTYDKMKYTQDASPYSPKILNTAIYKLNRDHSFINTFEVVLLPGEKIKRITLCSQISIPKDPKTYEEYMADAEITDKDWCYEECKIQHSKSELITIDNPIGPVKFFDYPIPMCLLPFSNLFIEVEFDTFIYWDRYIKLECLEHPGGFNLGINLYTERKSKPFYINKMFWDYFNILEFSSLDYTSDMKDIMVASVTDVTQRNISFTAYETLSKNNRLKLPTKYDFIREISVVCFPGESVKSISLFYRKKTDNKTEYIKVKTMSNGESFFEYPIPMFMFKLMGLSVQVEFENQRSDFHNVKIHGYCPLPGHIHALRDLAGKHD